MAEHAYGSYGRYGSYNSSRRVGETKPVYSEASNAHYRYREISSRDKMKIITSILIIGVLCVALVIMVAHVGNVTYHLNTTMKENAVIEGEIENLKIKIQEASKIEVIEQRAIEQLGMIYPDASQFVYPNQNEKPPEGFAQLLKAEAYN